MTTLELAHAIVLAVWHAQDPLGPFDNPAKDPGTQAVLRTLHDTGHWFCRIDTGPQGETIDTPLEQLELFRA